MTERPTGVLWDVGNVIVRWDPRSLYSKIFADAAERDWFLNQVCTQAWHDEHDRGRPMAEGVAELAAQFPETVQAIEALALERIGRPAQSLLFVDDNPRNIETASAMGFATHHFTDPTALEPALQEHGLL